MVLSSNTHANASSDDSCIVAIWLLVCALMIFVMVVLGGLTRLTHSGLSMVEWKPITGLLPPMNELAWQEAFRKYQQYPEFKVKNQDMVIADFKSIFWLEFVHRIWGRAIAVVFFIPFAFFLLLGRLDRALIAKLFSLFVIGGLQGILGWFMVKSGLIHQPDVSQYRLVAHLILAFLLYGYIFWLAMDLLFPMSQIFAQSMRAYKHACSALIFLLIVTIISGGFVAGTDAGLIYNTFPLMGGELLPKDLFALEPLMKNFFENVVTIQFTHRLLTSLVFIAILVFYCMVIIQDISKRTRIAAHCLLVAVILQLVLGILTLVLNVPVQLAIAHQAGALLLLTSILWFRHELRV